MGVDFWEEEGGLPGGCAHGPVEEGVQGETHEFAVCEDGGSG